MRGIIAVVVVCVVAVVAATWWFGWWNISTAPSADGKNTEFKLSVNKGKAKQDIAAVENKIPGGGHKDGSGNTEKLPARGQPLEGTIHTVDAGNHSFTVMNKENGEVTVRTDAATRIRIGDNEGALKDFQIGDRADVTYGAGTEENVAKTVTVTKRS
jgi:hypothetical protein